MRMRWKPKTKLLVQALVVCAIAGMAIVRPAAAFGIATPVDALQVRWDNTLRGNAAWRVQRQDPALLANAGIDDGNRHFNCGLVSTRIALLSEFDAVCDNSDGTDANGVASVPNGATAAFSDRGFVYDHFPEETLKTCSRKH